MNIKSKYKLTFSQFFEDVSFLTNELFKKYEFDNKKIDNLIILSQNCWTDIMSSIIKEQFEEKEKIHTINLQEKFDVWDAWLKQLINILNANHNKKNIVLFLNLETNNSFVEKIQNSLSTYVIPFIYPNIKDSNSKFVPISLYSKEESNDLYEIIWKKWFLNKKIMTYPWEGLKYL